MTLPAVRHIVSRMRAPHANLARDNLVLRPGMGRRRRARPTPRGTTMPANTKALMEKIQALPVDRIAEVEDFVDFIASREQDRSLVKAATAASVAAFPTVSNNPQNDGYYALSI